MRRTLEPTYMPPLLAQGKSSISYRAASLAVVYQGMLPSNCISRDVNVAVYLEMLTVAVYQRMLPPRYRREGGPLTVD